MSTRKEELIKELRLIQEEEKKKLGDEAYPMVKHFEGRYFKIEEDSFVKYIRVVNILKESIFRDLNNKITVPFAGMAIENDSFDSISFIFDYQGYVDELNEKSEITEKEFNDALKNSIKCISEKLEK